MEEFTDDHMSMAIRNPDGTFARGPGRKRGSRNRVSREAIEKIKELVPQVFEKLQENLGKGDMRAVEYVLDRILPAGRILKVDTTADGIRDHLERGDFSESEARAMATVIERLRHNEDMDVLTERLERMERLLEAGSI